MADVENIAHALEFIEAHLQEPIGVSEMAQAVAYSLYHFCRTFSRLTLHTPYDYLMRRRIAEAARALRQTDHKIIDVALTYQFNNPETFSRAFKRVLGALPQQWRKQERSAPRQLMPPLTLAHLRHWQRCAPWQPVVASRPAFDLIGAMVWLPDEASDNSAAWDWLQRALGTGASGPFYGLTCGASDGAADVAYLAAVCAEELPTTPHGLVNKPVPALTWVRVAHHGPACDFGLTLDYLYHTWLPQSSYRSAWPGYLESYGTALGRPDAEASVWEVAIPLLSAET